MLFNRRCCNNNMNMGCCNMGCRQPQMEQCVVEPTITKCIEKEFYHEIPHVCPIHTHTVNKHIYTHSYTPQYSCSEEEQVCNIDNGPCQKFA